MKKYVSYANKRRAVVALKVQRKSIENSDEEGEEEDEERYDEDEDPYAGIDLEAILSPIGHPSELPNHPGIARAFTRTTLSTLARRALDLICTEQKQLSQINRLLTAFLGDDPSYNLNRNLNLPEIYQHSGEGSADMSEFSNTRINGAVNGTIVNGTDHVKSEKNTEDSSIAQEDSNVDSEDRENETWDSKPTTRRITRNQATNELEPFFGLPKRHIDRDFGFPPDVAQETRQLAQMAAQRGEEFMRSLYKIRAGLLRADRFRGKVYKWCREVGGDISDDDEASKAK
ncbi:RXT2-like protein [Dipodascopsis uninucleata]